MGMSYSTFVGPYAHCTTLTRPAEKEVKVCPKRGCRFAKIANPMSDENKFCPQCGAVAKVKSVKIKGVVDEVVDAYDVMEATNERLYPHGNHRTEGEHIFVSNNTKSPGISLERGDGVGEIKQYDGVVIDQEISAWRDRHAKDLDILYEHYGEDRVEVRWGLLASYG